MESHISEDLNSKNFIGEVPPEPVALRPVAFPLLSFHILFRSR